MYRLILKIPDVEEDTPYFITIYPYDDRNLKKGEILILEVPTKKQYLEAITNYSRDLIMIHGQADSYEEHNKKQKG